MQKDPVIIKQTLYQAWRGIFISCIEFLLPAPSYISRRKPPMGSYRDNTQIMTALKVESLRILSTGKF